MPWLTKRPKVLYFLWHEYKFGVGGIKAAKLFTSPKRNANKFVFSRQLVFWRMFTSMVAKGHTSNLLIDSIYGVYGRNLGVTAILKQMKADKRSSGGHANLR